MKVIPIHSRASEEVVRHLEKLLQMARQGQLSGFSAALLYRGGAWDTLHAGTAITAPLEALGGVHVLAAELADIVNGKLPK